ncbi:hypothetical protein ABEY69_00545 [Priestia filamentosa]|uniref:hypothetical protein n=1 Tax=Priestia filamentosa TaxID=1402861 RepID=UPI003D2E755E
MFKRKILTALITSILSVIIISFITPTDSFFGEVHNYWKSVLQSPPVFSVYVFPAVFLYGLPVSLLIEKITTKMEAGQLQFSIIGYAFFGVLPFFLLWYFTIYSLGISLLFYLVDYILSKKKKPETVM